MPLVGANELLAAAERGGYAVPGFNVSNLEMAMGVIAAAEARHAPMFLQFNPSNLEHFGGVEVAGAGVVGVAAEHAESVDAHRPGVDQPAINRPRPVQGFHRRFRHVDSGSQQRLLRNHGRIGFRSDGHHPTRRRHHVHDA